ncbi:MAG: hypothetical protein EP343_00395 [Deltaproteobacteria bacterium]|nr:MAG: hypothetical protein EP343_00395 [Deltaproteobacteria bacterium]
MSSLETPRSRRRWFHRRWLWMTALLLATFSVWGYSSASVDGCQGVAKSYKRSPLLGLHWNKQSWRGTILQRDKAGPYTYLQFQPQGQKAQWMVTMGSGQASGTQAKVTVYGSKQPFYSRRLKRCFPTLYFGRITSSTQH